MTKASDIKVGDFVIAMHYDLRLCYGKIHSVYNKLYHFNWKTQDIGIIPGYEDKEWITLSPPLIQSLFGVTDSVS